MQHPHQTAGGRHLQITNASPLTGNYSARRFDGGNDWAWNVAIGSDNGDGTATVVEVGSVSGTSMSPDAIADIKASETWVGGEGKFAA
jgi:hypothetical protein